MKTFLLFVIIVFSYLVSYGQEIVILDDKKDVIYLGKYMQYYEDKGKLIQLEQIKSDTFQQYFKKFPQEILNLGTSRSAVWLKIQVNIQTSKKYYLQIDNSYLDSVLFYFQDEKDNYQYKLTGKKFPIETEDIASTHCIIELPTQNTQKVQIFYLRLISTRYLHIEAKLLSQKSILNSISKRYIVELTYFGVIILAILYNLFMYFSIKDIAFLYYVIYTFFIGLNIFNTRGYLSLFFSEYRELISQYTYLISSFYIIFVLLFTIQFLKVKRYSSLLYRILLFFLFISFLRTFLSYIGYGGLLFSSGITFLIINVSVYLISGVVIYYKKYQPAIYYLASWSFFGFFTLWASLEYTDILNFNSFSKYLSPTGVVLETIFSSFALANRINVLKKENEDIQKRNIAIIKTQKESLETEVKRRTEELEEKNQEIETQNEELSQQREELLSVNDHLEEKNKEVEQLNDHLEDIVSQRTNELRNTLDDLTKQNQDLAQFSYIISHNIRSPIARILGLINIFNEKDYDDNFNKEIISHLRKATTDLDIVIKDLTQIISVRNDLNKTKEQINILEIIELEQFLLQDEIKRSNAIINTKLVNIKSFLSIKSYFQSIIHNLLSNAIKYKSDKRSLIVNIKAELVSNIVCISVQDNGLGIDLTNTDTYKVFGLYQRMHDHVEGKGLGLFLVKTQIESLGGKVELDSQLDVGSTFKVYFPM